MNKKFRAEMLKLLPSFSVVDSHFYEPPANHIVCGFLCERPPSGAYIWKYAFPLYARADHISLSFGERLPRPDHFMYVERGLERALAAEFVRRIEPYRAEIAQRADLNNFLAYIETIKNSGSPWILRGYALTLIMLGRTDEALHQLRVLAGIQPLEDYTYSDVEATKDYPHFQEDIHQVLSDLYSGVDVAQKTLMTWELETKRCLGLI